MTDSHGPRRGGKTAATDQAIRDALARGEHVHTASATHGVRCNGGDDQCPTPRVDEPDLVTFLRARLNEDAQGAAEAGDSWYGYRPDQKIESVSDADNRHIARNSPFRVLSDVAAKQDLVKLHDTPSHECRYPSPFTPGQYSTEYQDGPCTTLRLLARPYYGHPDYCENWRP